MPGCARCAPRSSARSRGPRAGSRPSSAHARRAGASAWSCGGAPRGSARSWGRARVARPAVDGPRRAGASAGSCEGAPRGSARSWGRARGRTGRAEVRGRAKVPPGVPPARGRRARAGARPADGAPASSGRKCSVVRRCTPVLRPFAETGKRASGQAGERPGRARRAWRRTPGSRTSRGRPPGGHTVRARPDAAKSVARCGPPRVRRVGRVPADRHRVLLVTAWRHGAGLVDRLRASRRLAHAWSAVLSWMPCPWRWSASTAPERELRRKRTFGAPESSAALTVFGVPSGFGAAPTRTTFVPAVT